MANLANTNSSAAEARHFGGVSIKILLVEDDDVVADLVAKFLRALDYEVETVGTVGSALMAASAERFNLLISDIDLPDSTGHELLKKLRARGDPIQAIAMSGFGQITDIENSLRAGFLDHLTKPIELPVLVQAIGKACSVKPE